MASNWWGCLLFQTTTPLIDFVVTLGVFYILAPLSVCWYQMKETRGKTKGDQEAKGMESKISYMLTAKFVVREGGGRERERDREKERGRDVQIERERNVRLHLLANSLISSNPDVSYTKYRKARNVRTEMW